MMFRLSPRLLLKPARQQRLRLWNRLFGSSPAAKKTPKKVIIGGELGKTTSYANVVKSPPRINKQLGGLHDAGLDKSDDEEDSDDNDKVEVVGTKPGNIYPATKGSDEEDDEMEVDEDDDMVTEVDKPSCSKKKKKEISKKKVRKAKEVEGTTEIDSDEEGSVPSAPKKAKKSKATDKAKRKTKKWEKAHSTPDPKLERRYTEYFDFAVHVQPCPNTVTETHNVCNTAFQILKAADPAFCVHPVGHGADTMSVVTTREELPTKHKPLKQYFHFSGENKQWNNTIRDRPRKINGVMLISSHEEPKTLVDDLYVDLFSAGFEMSRKECQALQASQTFSIPKVFPDHSLPHLRQLNRSSLLRRQSTRVGD